MEVDPRNEQWCGLWGDSKEIDGGGRSAGLQLFWHGLVQHCIVQVLLVDERSERELRWKILYHLRNRYASVALEAETQLLCTRLRVRWLLQQLLPEYPRPGLRLPLCKGPPLRRCQTEMMC